MLINKAYKTKLKPTREQRKVFENYAGAARFVYNWALADRIDRYEQGNPTGLFEQKKRFNELKHKEFSWIENVDYNVQDQAFRNLDSAYSSFFRRIKSGSEKAGFPKFKSKNASRKSFTTRRVSVERDSIRLPRIGWVRLAEKNYLPSHNDAKINSATISEVAGDWFVSLQVEQEISDDIKLNNNRIGVDLGVKSFATISNGKQFDNPHVLYEHEKKIARLNRELSRRKKGSNNRQKTKDKLAKEHAKIANIRKHLLHNASKYATYKCRPKAVAMEDLNIKGMTKNRHLSKAISDASMAELKRQIEYKAGWIGSEFVLVDRFYPSSKTCSRCGAIKDGLKLSDRVYRCDKCGLVIDRDLNAAKNIAAISEPGNGGGLPVELECSNALL